MTGSATSALQPWARDLLRCTLIDGTGPDGEPELVSTDPVRPLAYPVRDGIPVLLIAEARPVEVGPAQAR